MKLIAACDGRDAEAFIATLANVAPVAGTTVIFAHVVDTDIEGQWSDMVGHRWLRQAGSQGERDRFMAAAKQAADEIVQQALALSAHWPATERRPVTLSGNPERELVRLALQEQADVLAIGQHRRELGPHALGRCSRFVVDHAPCPVLLVRDATLRAAAPRLLGDRLHHGPPRPHTGDRAERA
jgi:nucleotide-binding universal stress UspA family protein